MGYFFIVNDSTEWDVTIGPAYTYTKFVTVEEGNSSKANSSAFQLESKPSMLLVLRFPLKVNRRLRSIVLTGSVEFGVSFLAQ
ncbi:DUF481 domain-containing protein [Vibrio salilacus]|uniref:DUF481 domain-containing protein n=1 Tax=Vibrio salilacus TaxID=1323749 RepID=UPI001FEB0672|nr:DUF481 domain-containing protein [Vibrio salilacus]